MKKTTTKIQCQNCSCDIFLPAWEAKKRKFCSLSCTSYFRMNKTDFGKKVVANIQSKEVRAKANETYKSDEYRKKRSHISKQCATPFSRAVSRKTLRENTKDMFDDPEWKKEQSLRAKKLVSEGKLGAHSHKEPINGRGFMFGKPTVHVRTGLVMRSSWEVKFANLCDDKNISWEYESDRFDFGWTTYKPDFKLSNELFIDVKPKRRLELQPGIKTRFDKLINEFKERNMNLLLLDKSEFSKFIGSKSWQ